MASGVFARAAMAAKEVTPGTISSHSGQPIRCSRKTQVLNNMASPRVDKPDLPARRHLLGQRRGNVVPHRLFFRAVGAHRKMAAADLRVCAQVLAYDGERQAVAAFAAGWRIQHIQLAEDPRRTHGDQIGRPGPLLRRIVCRSCCFLHRVVQRQLQMGDKHRPHRRILP